MNLSNFGVEGGRRKSLIVLGAGASRGASFVTDSTRPLPPLDLDFFQQITRMDSSAAGSELLGFVRDEYGHEVGLSMERFFSEADYTDRFHRVLNIDPGPVVKRYQKALQSFYFVLPKLLNSTTSTDCKYHELIAKLLHAEDCVLSFNYDLVMDRALRRWAGVRWDPGKNGYGFGVAGGANNWCKHGKGRPVSTSIRHLKMHGSLHWRRYGNGVSLVADPSKVTTLAGSIIPPTWFKPLDEFPFGDVWKQARREVRTARIMIVVGYSVPATDLFSRSLFKVEAGSKEKRERLDLLVLVNPDRSARRNFLELVRGGIEPNTRILEYRKLKHLHTLLERNS